MKPRSFERGKTDNIGPPISKGNASMKPRSFERGKLTLGTVPYRKLDSFNEAAFF